MPLLTSIQQDRETEPRFTGPPSRGDFAAGSGGMRGGYQGGGGYGGGQMGASGGGSGGSGGGGRQLYISNVGLVKAWHHQDLANLLSASVQCRLARLERSFPRSW